MGLDPILNRDDDRDRVYTREEILADQQATLKNRSELPDRMTFTSTIYHQDMADEPTSYQLQWDRHLVSKEQPYIRKKGLIAFPEWSSIDYGFLTGKPIGLIMIYNLEGFFNQVQPTSEERTEASAKVLEIAYRGASKGFLVPSRESYAFYPDNAADVVIRCSRGACRYSLVAIPG